MVAVSEPVVTVFKLVGRQEPKNPGVGEGQTRLDLLIQPMMVREGSDGKLPGPCINTDAAGPADSAQLCNLSRD